MSGVSVTRIGSVDRPAEFEIGHGPDDEHLVTLTEADARDLVHQLTREIDRLDDER